jgi:hypothetical protein
MIKKIIDIALEWRIHRKSLLKSRKILMNIDHIFIRPDVRRKYLKKWRRFQANINEIYLKNYSSISGIQSEDFVPENIYYSRIEPVLNKKAFTPAYADKNFYQRYLHEFEFLFPKTILRGINCEVYDAFYQPVNDLSVISKYFQNNGCYILKPASETSGGKNVLSFEIRGGNYCFDQGMMNQRQFIHFLLDSYPRNFVIQEKIIQHPFYSGFNKSSINTIRLFTYRSVKDNQIVPLQSVLRFGQQGCLVDNQASGGRSVGIGIDGLLNEFSIDKWGNKCILHVDTSKDFKIAIPGYSKMKKFASLIAPRYYYHRLLGFDFCFTSNEEVKLLEINCKNIEINFQQMNNGPLFGDITDEVIDHCIKNKKSIVLDFEI